MDLLPHDFWTTSETPWNDCHTFESLLPEPNLDDFWKVDKVNALPSESTFNYSPSWIPSKPFQTLESKLATGNWQRSRNIKPQTCLEPVQQNSENLVSSLYWTSAVCMLSEEPSTEELTPRPLCWTYKEPSLTSSHAKQKVKKNPSRPTNDHKIQPKVTDSDSDKI